MNEHIDATRMKKLLAQDLPQNVIAKVLGCSEGFVSQKAAEFAEEVVAMKIAKLSAASDTEERREALEGTLLEKLEKAVDFMLRPAELLAAYKTITGASNKTAAALANGGNATQQGQLVTVVLPQVLAINFVQNQQGEIIEAGGRSLATLPSAVLKQMAKTNGSNNSQVLIHETGQRNKAETRDLAQLATI